MPAYITHYLAPIMPKTITVADYYLQCHGRGGRQVVVFQTEGCATETCPQAGRQGNERQAGSVPA